jgi:hypothetical protein
MPSAVTVLEFKNGKGAVNAFGIASSFRLRQLELTAFSELDFYWTDGSAAGS